MFAHQVIEQLNSIDWIPVTNHPEAYEFYMLRIKSCIKDIKDAQCFNLGESAWLWRLAEGQEGKLLFRDGLGSVRLPYRVCWFDFLDPSGASVDVPEKCRSSKRALLAREINDKLIFVEVFNFMTVNRVWHLSPECPKCQCPHTRESDCPDCRWGDEDDGETD